MTGSLGAIADAQNKSTEIDRFIRLQDVEDIIGLKRSQIYKMISEGAFPRHLKIGCASRWSLRAVKAWMDQQVSEAM
jgi:prophage regulatory protein